MNKTYIYMPWCAVREFPSPSVETFPDGETGITIPPVEPTDHVVLYGSCHDAQASETFLATAYEVAYQGPASLTVVNTYFRHARSDRRFDERTAVMAKFQARQWSGLGHIFPGVRLMFLHLHSDQILSFFEGPVRTSNVSGFPVLERLWRHEHQDMPNVVYATVDHGGVHEVRKLINRHHGPGKPYIGFASIEKKRYSSTETQVLGIQGDVRGMNVVIFDDMISTGGSLVQAAEAYKKQGALSITALATHGVFVGDALERLQAAPIDQVWVTDSHPNVFPVNRAPNFLQVVSFDVDDFNL